MASARSGGDNVTKRDVNTYVMGLAFADLVKFHQELGERIDERRSDELKALKESMVEQAEAAGFSQDEVFGRKPTSAGAYGPQGQAKYRNPENTKETWSGRGRKPNWLLAKLEEGDSKLEDYLIKK